MQISSTNIEIRMHFLEAYIYRVLRHMVEYDVTEYWWKLPEWIDEVTEVLNNVHEKLYEDKTEVCTEGHILRYGDVATTDHWMNSWREENYG